MSQKKQIIKNIPNKIRIQSSFLSSSTTEHVSQLKNVEEDPMAIEKKIISTALPIFNLVGTGKYIILNLFLG